MLETRVVMLGPDGVGKTSLLYKMKYNEDVKTIPTIGFNTETIKYKDREIIIWDIGGKQKIKSLREHYPENPKCFEFRKCFLLVVDISKKKRLEEYKEVFKSFFEIIKDSLNCKIVIFGNKFNDNIEIELEELLENCAVPPEISPFLIKGNVKTGEGLTELLDYIYENAEFKKTEKEVNEEIKEEEDNEEINEEEDNNNDDNQKEDAKILMLGLDDSGKTTILYLLKLGEIVKTIRTIGLNVETIDNNEWGKSIAIWDVGGYSKIRILWKHYLTDIKGLIWVYDISNKTTLEESKDELKKVLSNEQVGLDIPLLIYANKNDQNVDNNNINDFLKGIEDNLSTRQYNIEICSINDPEIYKNGLNWLCNQIS